jgi:hypothetical protein
VKRSYVFLILFLALVTFFAMRKPAAPPTTTAPNTQTAVPATVTPVKRTPKEQKEWESRNLFRVELERGFLRAGLDITVGNVVPDAGGDDNRHLFISGGDVITRPFVYNFLDGGARATLRNYGFVKVSFLGGWDGEYDVETGKLTAATAR